MKIKRVTFAALVALPLIIPGYAYAKSYEYASIDVIAKINEDSSVDITETQTFNFEGSFSSAWRRISLRGIGAIADVNIRDLTTNQPVNFDHRREGGEYVVEWSYNATDTQRTWELSYTVHGAIGFHDGHDELYWNVFTDYDVPVRSSTATVILPRAVASQEMLQAQVYADAPGATAQIIDNQTFQFALSGAQPQSAFTIAAGWPKGLVSQRAYWEGALKRNWGILAAILVFAVAIGATTIRWIQREYLPAKRQTIIAQYEPPGDLTPAMAEVIANERTSNKTWPATLVHLAVKGYVTIEEEEKSWLDKITRQTNYTIHNQKEFAQDTSLEGYEQAFLGILFGKQGERASLSTKDLRKASNSAKQAMSRKMQKLQQVLYKELAGDIDAYAVPPSRGKLLGLGIGLFAASIAAITVFIFSGALPARASQPMIFGIAAAASIGIFLIFSRFNPRLTEPGNKLRAQILGFELYLKTAERYRLQNLTPDMFQLFLPYAMVFGVEKQWAKAFETLNIKIEQPAWYAGAAYHAGASTSGSGFSASAFSSSFSSSLASAVSSSTGASGGGGSAGGGAGGGGGGAS